MKNLFLAAIIVSAMLSAKAYAAEQNEDDASEQEAVAESQQSEYQKHMARCKKLKESLDSCIEKKERSCLALDSIVGACYEGL
jgi:hypothetical protein